jgi:hypothetical protein
MERYALVTAAQQREAADLLERPVAGRQPGVFESVTESGEGAESQRASPRIGESVG